MTETSRADTLLRAANAYAARGWAVFPVHRPTDAGCSCHRDDCGNTGKHPRTINGFKDATTDPDQIAKWWSMWPLANIGIACGPSGLTVIDVDPRHGGDETFRDLEERYGETLTETVIALTGSGGAHYLYRASDSPVGSSVNAWPGVDIRGHNGYIVAPPSLHASGRTYEWERPASRYELAPFPDIMTPRPVRALAPMVGSEIPNGARNETLTSLAGSMRRRGMTEEAITAALLVENKRCQTPLPTSDIQRIARSIVRYEPSKDVPVKTTGLMEYQRLRKQATKPPMYVVEVAGVDVRVTMSILRNHASLRTAAAEQADILVPAMKAGEWDATLSMLLESLEVLPAPDDASEEGLFWDYMVQFLRRADDDQTAIQEGRPLRLQDEILTNGRQLVNALMLHNIKAKPSTLWAIVEAHGGEKRNVMINGKQLWVWAIPDPTDDNG